MFSANHANRTNEGCEPQLEVHINGALNVGIPSEKLVKTFLQCEVAKLGKQGKVLRPEVKELKLKNQCIFRPCARDAEGAKRLPIGNGAAQDGEPRSKPGFYARQRLA